MTTHRALAVLPGLLALAACGGGSSGLSEAQVEARLNGLAADYVELLTAGSTLAPTSTLAPVPGAATYNGVFVADASNGDARMEVAAPMSVTTGFGSGATTVGTGPAMARVTDISGVNYAEAGSSLNWTWIYDNSGSTRQVYATLDGDLSAGGHALTFTDQFLSGGFFGEEAGMLALSDEGSGTRVDGALVSNPTVEYIGSN